MANQYRKKPLIVEAIQYDGTNGDEVRMWSKWEIREYYRGLFVGVNTPAFSVKDGGWIIKHPDGDYFSLDNQEFEATYEPVQPTTNCSTLENDFTARKTKWGSWSGDIWEVNNKHGELVGHITEFGFKLYDQPTWGTPSELRQLADLVEATLKGNE